MENHGHVWNYHDLVQALKYIDLETISDYLFNQLEINPDDILEIDLNTGRWDVKQVLFKPGVSMDH